MLVNNYNLESNFKDKNLLKLAFTHKSWINENESKGETNERLEFLGDAVLEFIVSKELYKRFPKEEEGYLTALRANLVNTINLAVVAKKLGIGKKLFLSKGEEDGGGRENQSILANTIEAIIGGLYLDSGIKKTEDFISKFIIVDIEEKINKPLKDAKSRLQEKVQAQGFPAPKYVVASETGPDHNKTFVISVLVNDKVIGSGSGKNKSEAEQEAARVALEKTLP